MEQSYSRKYSQIKNKLILLTSLVFVFFVAIKIFSIKIIGIIFFYFPWMVIANILPFLIVIPVFIVSFSHVENL